ncbi:FxsA family protein [Sporosarcina cyprini]|uniref:FxsA family protein n=1 Tax=Sporosarcina cyprini TaxID=2910523 RepID=UPI001EDCC266|nr:FxsA family protein [Sporosarcina cyprini]MCG3089393.1 membrane protein FxsA [Sporosarcina cyprini]
MRWLVLAFILIPSTEIAVLIYSGKTLGVFPTIALVFLTAVGGAYLAKRQGLKAWRDLQARMRTMETPGNALIDSICIFIGGILLIMPGFITDLCGLLLLFPGPRKLIRPFIVKWLHKKMQNGSIVIR